MFGRVRAATSSAESLERPPSKILKDHSLSVYESTFMKLKLGAKLQFRSGSDETNPDNDHVGDLITADQDSNPDDELQDSFKSKLPAKSNVSLVSMFSKYNRRSQELLISSCDHNDDGDICARQQSFQGHVCCKDCVKV